MSHESKMVAIPRERSGPVWKEFYYRQKRNARWKFNCLGTFPTKPHLNCHMLPHSQEICTEKNKCSYKNHKLLLQSYCLGSGDTVILINLRLLGAETTIYKHAESV